MVTAIVLVQAERLRIPETAAELANVTHVKEVYSVTGEWDIVALLRLPSYEDLDDVVTGQLRRLPGIMRTQTMLAFRTYAPELLDQGFGVGLNEQG
ncbi:Lrp/AsnC ligand binding domain-containing protein [Deinococcus maricopensis]|uniref:Transcription regulator, AsnC-type n=1 Tax=Deinococcus maricopensis (strain DSM 21211 / LMG 22137 / NRRL B-23946 / LB-34) TaxID=709986 RepID=E8U6F2_DEIML|nr:Lrp/AsnC ligand binding domain-containing protein [Deinococcus maricopensis]ADV66641.1 Transcription regulator, AsnC-type [Deinococcus maricopensis DSM 21211]